MLARPGQACSDVCRFAKRRCDSRRLALVQICHGCRRGRTDNRAVLCHLKEGETIRKHALHRVSKTITRKINWVTFWVSMSDSSPEHDDEAHSAARWIPDHLHNSIVGEPALALM
jgi:hypothetical protein